MKELIKHLTIILFFSVLVFADNVIWQNKQCTNTLTIAGNIFGWFTMFFTYIGMYESLTALENLIFKKEQND